MLEVVGVRHRERVVRGDRAAVVVERLEQREVDDPEEVEPTLVHRRTARARRAACRARGRRAGAVPAATSSEVARLRRRACRRCRSARPRTGTSATWRLERAAVDARASTRGRRRRAAWPGRRACRPARATSPPSPGSADALHRVGLERAELGGREHLAEVDELEAEADVGLVGAVALHAPGARSCAPTGRRARRR